MLELAFARFEAIADLASGALLGQLTKQHGDKLVSTRKAPGVIFGPQFPHVVGKTCALKKNEDLAKKTSRATHFGLR